MTNTDLSEGTRSGAAAPNTLGKNPVARYTNPNALVSLLQGLKLSRNSGLLIFAIVIVIFALWIPDTFLTSVTVKNILQTQALTAILALGLLFPLAAGVFDLSVAQNIGFSAMVCGYFMVNQHQSVILSVVITAAFGVVVGCVNGLLVAFVGLDSFIATLGMQSLLLAGAQLIGNGQYIGPFPSSIRTFATRSVLGVPIVAVYLLILAIIAWYALEHTPAGRRFYATGANADAARLAGIRTRRYVFWSFVICATLAALAGVLLAGTLNSVSETTGPEYLLPAFAGAFLGATQLKPGRFNVWGTLLAIYLLGTGVTGLQLAGGQVWLTNLFNGAALIIAVSAAVIANRMRRRKDTQRHEAI